MPKLKDKKLVTEYKDRKLNKIRYPGELVLPTNKLKFSSEQLLHLNYIFKKKLEKTINVEAGT